MKMFVAGDAGEVSEPIVVDSDDSDTDSVADREASKSEEWTTACMSNGFMRTPLVK